MNNREDIVIVQKETFKWKVVIIGGDGKEVDITGMTHANLNAKKYIGATESVIELAIGSGIQITNATMGEITISISSSDTSDFSFSTIHYDLFYSMDGIIFVKYKKGVIRLEKSV